MQSVCLASFVTAQVSAVPIFRPQTWRLYKKYCCVRLCTSSGVNIQDDIANYGFKLLGVCFIFCLPAECNMSYDPWKNYANDSDGVLLHATAVAVGVNGLLILGPSGAGKSHLAIEMLAQGAHLVSDDRVWLGASENGLILYAATPLVGRVEARGLGLISCTTQPSALLKYCLDLSLMSDARLPFPLEVTRLGHRLLVLPGGPIAPQAAALLLLLKNGFSAYD